MTFNQLKKKALKMGFICKDLYEDEIYYKGLKFTRSGLVLVWVWAYYHPWLVEVPPDKMFEIMKAIPVKGCGQ